jgi:hypothetical protein
LRYVNLSFQHCVYFHFTHFIIADEGHLLKNDLSETYKALNTPTIPSKRVRGTTVLPDRGVPQKFEREALALLTSEQRAKFDEDEAIIRRDKEAQNALRQEVRAAKKRKRGAVEEAKIRLVEKIAKDKREAYEPSKRRRVDPPACQGNTVAQVTVPFVTPNGDPILPGDLFHQLQTAFAAGKFVIPGTASDPVVSDLLKALDRISTPAKVPPPSATTGQAQTTQPSASTSQAKGAKTPRRQPAAGRKKAEASKEAQAQILNPPALLSPISPKPTKGKALGPAEQLREISDEVSPSSAAFHMTKDTREAKITRWLNYGGVFIVGYRMYKLLTKEKEKRSEQDELFQRALVNPGPDLLVCGTSIYHFIIVFIFISPIL